MRDDFLAFLFIGMLYTRRVLDTRRCRTAQLHDISGFLTGRDGAAHHQQNRHFALGYFAMYHGVTFIAARPRLLIAHGHFPRHFHYAPRHADI